MSSKVFVIDGSKLNKLRHAALRRRMTIGSCLKTPLEKKAQFTFLIERIDDKNWVTQVTYYAPGSNLPNSVFNLKGQARIKPSDWFEMVQFSSEHEALMEAYNEKAIIHTAIKAFEEAAKIHGARQAAVANGFISNPEPFLRETGKILKEARENLYAEVYAL